MVVFRYRLFIFFQYLIRHLLLQIRWKTYHWLPAMRIAWFYSHPAFNRPSPVRHE
jgi:hypothetical protein